MKEKFKPFAHAEVRITNPKDHKSVRSLNKAPVFIDTGASITILHEELAPILDRLGPLDRARAIVNTANGPKETTAIKDVTVCVAQVCSRGNILVSDSVPGHILIGSDFLSRAKCKVDFGKKELVCGGKKIKFEMEE